MKASFEGAILQLCCKSLLEAKCDSIDLGFLTGDRFEIEAVKVMISMIDTQGLYVASS